MHDYISQRVAIEYGAARLRPAHIIRISSSMHESSPAALKHCEHEYAETAIFIFSFAERLRLLSRAASIVARDVFARQW